MHVELVRTTTRDGVRLDGAFQAAAGGAGLGLDGACLVHGTGGSFYSSVLLANTRGHDVVSNAATAQGGRHLGAAYEVVDDCRHDLAAWLDWLRQRVGSRLALIGHSLGAVKCLYATAHEPQAGVGAAVAV